jgi:hypothetical protein
MTPNAAISRAAMPESHIVAGVRLLPFCIGHWLNLSRVDSSFLDDNKDHELGDLLISTFICAQPYETFADSLRTGTIKREMAAWHRRLAGGFSHKWNRRLRRMLGKPVFPGEVLGIDMPAACEAFQNYLDEHGAGQAIVNDWSVPITASVQKEGGTTLKSPPLMVLFDALVSECHLPPSYALNMPLPLARWTWAIHAERTGRVSVIDADDRSDDQKAANEFAASILRSQIN